MLHTRYAIVLFVLNASVIQDRVEAMADQEERPVARQIRLLVKAALELLDEQGFKLVDGKLRKVSIESMDDLEEGT